MVIAQERRAHKDVSFLFFALLDPCMVLFEEASFRQKSITGIMYVLYEIVKRALNFDGQIKIMENKNYENEKKFYFSQFSYAPFSHEWVTGWLTIHAFMLVVLLIMTGN